MLVFLNIDSDSALERTNQKFTKRLSFIENIAKKMGNQLMN